MIALVLALMLAQGISSTAEASLGELGVLGPRIVTYTGEGELQRIIDEILQRRAGAKTKN